MLNKKTCNKAKYRQSDKHAKTEKYKKQFFRTVKRTGKWRGKKAELYS